MIFFPFSRNILPIFLFLLFIFKFCVLQVIGKIFLQKHSLATKIVEKIVEILFLLCAYIKFRLSVAGCSLEFVIFNKRIGDRNVIYFIKKLKALPVNLCKIFFVFRHNHKFIFVVPIPIFRKTAIRTLTTILLPACLYIWVSLTTILKLSSKPINRKHSRGDSFLIRPLRVM